MKKVLLALLMVLVGVSLFATGQSEGSAENQEVTLRFLNFMTGVDPKAPWIKTVVDGFNEEYEGRIKVELDNVAGDAAFLEKIRLDAASDTMPDIFMLSYKRNEFNVLADSGRVADLNPYLASDPVLRAALNDPAAVRAYTDSAGHLLGVPYSRAFVGIYYNKEIFADAGISEFPTTWSDFLDVSQKLRDAGHIPISLNTAEGGWTAMLMMAHHIGTSPGGLEWLRTPAADQNLEADVFINAAKLVQTLFMEYSTPDAIGADYGIASNNFYQGNTAMIANGPWMESSFRDPDVAPEGFGDKVVYALAPGNGVIAMENISFASGSKTEAKLDAAVEFLKYLTTTDVYAEYLTYGAAPAIQIDPSLIVYPPILNAFVPKAVGAENKYTIIPNAVKSAVIESISQILPELASGRITAEEFARELQAISDAN